MTKVGAVQVRDALHGHHDWALPPEGSHPWLPVDVHAFILVRNLSRVPVSVAGAREHATPDVLARDDVEVHTIAAAVLAVRMLPAPLAAAPSVPVTTVLVTPAVVTVVVDVVALNVSAILSNCVSHQ